MTSSFCVSAKTTNGLCHANGTLPTIHQAVEARTSIPWPAEKLDAPMNSLLLHVGATSRSSTACTTSPATATRRRRSACGRGPTRQWRRMRTGWNTRSSGDARPLGGGTRHRRPQGHLRALARARRRRGLPLHQLEEPVARHRDRARARGGRPVPLVPHALGRGLCRARVAGDGRRAPGQADGRKEYADRTAVRLPCGVRPATGQTSAFPNDCAPRSR